MTHRKAIGLALAVLVFLSFGVMGIIQAQDFGSGWTATFYTNTALTGTGIPVSNVGAINFNWGTGVPIINGVAVPGIAADNFSATFLTTYNFAAAGTYTFTAVYDDGMRVYIDGALVFDRFTPHAQTTETFTQSLTAGPHNLKVDYFEGIDQSILQFQWGLTGAPAGTAGPTPTQGPTATPAPTNVPSVPAGALAATIVRAPVVNVRSAPSAYAARLGSVLRGQTYAIVGRDADARWFLLQLSNYQGWVNGYYLSINLNEFNAPVVSDYLLEGNPAATTGVVARSTSAVKLRAAPTIYADQIGRIVWGGAVGITGKNPSGEWWRVVWKGTEGWVWGAYFKVVEGDLADVPVVNG